MTEQRVTRIYVRLTQKAEEARLQESLKKRSRTLTLQPAFPPSEPNDRARARAKRRGTGKAIDLSAYRTISVDDPDIDVDELCRALHAQEDVESLEIEEFPQPLYNPADPQGLDFALTDQQLTHATDPSSLDLSKGAGTVIGVIEMPYYGAGADYTRQELGGTGDQAADWAAIQAGTHAKFDLYTDANNNPVDPYGTGHGDRVVPRCAAIEDNGIAYLGTAPDARVLFAYQNNISAAVKRLADLGVDVISISYTGSWGRRLATQYAVSQGVVVVDAHANNTNAETSTPKPYEAINVGGYRQSDYATARSWGIGLTLLATSTDGATYESYATPTVAGAAAALLAANPGWNPYDVHRALIQSAFKPGQMAGETFTRTHGWGLLRIHRALKLSLADLNPLPPVDVKLQLHAGRVAEITWTNRPITNDAGVRIVASKGTPPTAAPGHEIEIDLPSGSTSAQMVLPSSGDWSLAVLGRSTDGRFSEVVEYVRLSIEPYIYRCPKAPTIQPTSTPTTSGTVTLTGTKERRTSIRIHDVEVVPLDDLETWSATLSLDLGGNLIPVRAVDEYGEASDPAYAFVDRQMYVRLAGDTMSGPLQLDNSGASGGLRLRKGTNGLPEWSLKTSREDLVFAEPDDGGREVLRIRDIRRTSSPTLQLGALPDAVLSADELERLKQAAVVRHLSADDGTRIVSVNFGEPRKVLAFISMTSSDPRHDHDHGDMYAADIVRIDGFRTPGAYSYGGAHLGPDGSATNLLPAYFRGTATTIDFRLRSFQDATVWATGVVLPQP